METKKQGELVQNEQDIDFAQVIFSSLSEDTIFDVKKIQEELVDKMSHEDLSLLIKILEQLDCGDTVLNGLYSLISKSSEKQITSVLKLMSITHKDFISSVLIDINFNVFSNNPDVDTKEDDNDPDTEINTFYNKLDLLYEIQKERNVLSEGSFSSILNIKEYVNKLPNNRKEINVILHVFKRTVEQNEQIDNKYFYFNYIIPSLLAKSLDKIDDIFELEDKMKAMVAYLVNLEKEKIDNNSLVKIAENLDINNIGENHFLNNAFEKQSFINKLERIKIMNSLGSDTYHEIMDKVHEYKLSKEQVKTLINKLEELNILTDFIKDEKGIPHILKKEVFFVLKEILENREYNNISELLQVQLSRRMIYIDRTYSHSVPERSFVILKGNRLIDITEESQDHQVKSYNFDTSNESLEYFLHTHPKNMVLPSWQDLYNTFFNREGISKELIVGLGYNASMGGFLEISKNQLKPFSGLESDDFLELKQYLFFILNVYDSQIKGAQSIEILKDFINNINKDGRISEYIQISIEEHPAPGYKFDKETSTFKKISMDF